MGFTKVWFPFAKLVTETRNEIIHKTVDVNQNQINMDKYQAILGAMTPEMKKELEDAIKVFEKSPDPRVRELAASLKLK